MRLNDIANESVKTMTEEQTTKKEKSGVDWKAIQERIAAAKKSLENVGAVSEQKRERIWKERAIQFARKPADESVGDVVHLVIVKMERDLCAFEVSNIESIRPVEEITRVPRVPQWVAGVASLRGHVYTVTDLQKFLRLNNGHDRGKVKGDILLVKTQRMRFALRVDRAHSVEMVRESRIAPVSETIQGVKPEFIRGVIENYEFNDEKIPVLVLNMDALLSDENLIVREEFV